MSPDILTKVDQQDDVKKLIRVTLRGKLSYGTKKLETFLTTSEERL